MSREKEKKKGVPSRLWEGGGGARVRTFRVTIAGILEIPNAGEKERLPHTSGLTLFVNIRLVAR